MNFQFKSKKNSAGFTLPEILVYIAVLAIIISGVLSFFLLATRSNTKAKAMRETLNNAKTAMEIMIYEIKEAKSIYTPTTTSNQLSLETTKYLPGGEKTSYLDFYLCGTKLCFKKESQNPIALTSDQVEVSNLVFTQVGSQEIPSIQIDLKVDYKNPLNRPEYRTSVSLISTASLRSY